MKKSEETRRIEAEIEQQKRTAGRIGRVIGAVLAGVGALLAGAVYEGMSARAVYSVELLFFSAWVLAAGALMLVFGVGGAPRVRDVPTSMWAALAVVSALVGLVMFVPLGRVLASWAGFSDL